FSIQPSQSAIRPSQSAIRPIKKSSSPSLRSHTPLNPHFIYRSNAPLIFRLNTRAVYLLMSLVFVSTCTGALSEAQTRSEIPAPIEAQEEGAVLDLAKRLEALGHEPPWIEMNSCGFSSGSREI